MKRGRNSGWSGHMDPLEKALAAWGEAMPPEVRALALACRAQTARAVAERLGYSGAVISHVLAKKYPGDIARVFVTIRGAFMGETAECPVLGEISKDQCLNHQGKPFSTANPARARLYRACRRCPNRQQKDSV
jgi:hypothetical protein